MKKAFHVLALSAVFTVAGFIPARGESPAPVDTSSAAGFTSTCWLTCYTFNPFQSESYKAFNVTESACCSGSVLSCPSGWLPTTLAWGEPLEICNPGGEG